jgi:hypothetical protein
LHAEAARSVAVRVPLPSSACSPAIVPELAVDLDGENAVQEQEEVVALLALLDERLAFL